MGFRGLFEGWHIVILVLVVVVVFGWKRLPDASRSLGRSMRIFKSEVSEMKNDNKTAPSTASAETVRGDVVPPVTEPGTSGSAPAQPTYVAPPVHETIPAPQDHQHSA